MSTTLLIAFQRHIHGYSLLSRSKIFVMRKLKVTELNRLTPEAFKKSKKIPLIVVLDHVRSLNNVGSVFQNLRCFPGRGYLSLWYYGLPSERRDP